jgi:predicted Rossmann-fold nucleotide-binding protein
MIMIIKKYNDQGLIAVPGGGGTVSEALLTCFILT